MIRFAKNRTVLNFLILGLSCLCTCELRAQVPAATLPKKSTINEAYAFVNDAESSSSILQSRRSAPRGSKKIHYRGHRADGRRRESGTDGRGSAPFPWSAPFREYFLTSRTCAQDTSSGNFSTSGFPTRSGLTERACRN